MSLRAGLVLLLVPIAVACSPKPQQAKASVAEADALSALNQTARGAYRAGKERMLAGLGPTIVVEGDKLVMLHAGKRSDAPIKPERYHDQKTFDHLALALEAVLGDVDGPLDARRLASLRELRGRIDPALRQFETRSYPAPVVARSREIAASASTLLDSILARGAVEHAAYVQFARTMGPLLLASIADAARAELDAIHKHVTAFRASMPPSEWDRLQVVVMGAHMAREQSLEMQYFQRLLGEPVEGKRIVFAESIFDESKALDLLATHMIDARLGASFFGDPMRLHRDALADAAAEYVPTLLP